MQKLKLGKINWNHPDLISWEKVQKDMNWSPEDLREIDRGAKYLLVQMKLREQRRKLGLTQAMLAAKAKLPRTTITKIESGKRNVTIETLMDIAEAMGKELEINFK